jgi:lipopolysaccharide biosynthesis regulator YciM
MHISLSPPSSPPEVRARRALLEADLAWLREELAGAKSPEQKASILYQLGVLEQLAGRDSLAVRQLLAAVNTVAFFKEPLERLIVLIERHRSFKNLPTLLEHLCRTAEGSEEVARAHLAHAWYLLQSRDPSRALPLLERALEAAPRDPAALLALELWARRNGDAASLRRALEARLANARHPEWVALLGMELAELETKAGSNDRANELLRNASELRTPLAFAAIERRFELGRHAGRNDWMIESLDARATRIVEVLGESDPDAAALVPSSWRDLAFAVGALCMLAELQREAGQDAAALATLERARRIDPSHPLVNAALLDQAERAGANDLLEELTLAELATEPTAAEAAALWLRLAESRAKIGRSRDAIAALHQAQGLEPRCWLARARELDLAYTLGDAEHVATALSQIAREVSTGAARGRYWLLAADAWGRRAGATGLARDAIARAEDAGVPRALARRVERALAHVVADRSWYDAATRRLLETDVDDVERVGLELESWRNALLAGDAELANERLLQLEATSSGRRVARLARAYTPDAADSSDALTLLADAELDPARAAALGWALGLRLREAGDGAGAIAALMRVHARYPRSPAIAGTLSAWLRERGDPLAAAEVLHTTAAALGDDPFASSLAVEAGLARWWAGDRDAALRDFELARGPGIGASALGEWTRRAAASGAGETAASSEPEEQLLAALERATATAAPTARELNDLNAALRAATNVADDGLVAAAHLANLALSRLLNVRVDPTALERAASIHADFAELAACYRFLEQIGQPEPSPRGLEESARRWSDESGGLVAALEWLGASVRLGQRRVECAARERVSELLTGDAAEHARAAAALVAHLTQSEPVEPLVGETPVTRLTNLELSPPGSDPRRRARALEGVGDLLGTEADPILSLLRGYNQLAAADVDAAISSFRRYTDAFPDDPSGWEGLLAAARRGDDPALLAEAASTLGSTCRDPAHAARLFEEAAEVFFDRLGDEVAGQAALARAVALDITRTSSFTRLLASMRTVGSPQELEELLERRLPVVSSNAERVDLSYELARARRQRDDLEGALGALDVVTDHEPDHLGAMALYGEIFITLRRYPEAVDRLARLAARPDAPPDYRIESGIAAADLCEDQLGMSARALEILIELDRAGLGSLSLRERLARSAAKSGAYADAAEMFERLMFERGTAAERAEAARLALVIHRDELGAPAAAATAVQVLLELIPNDPEALDLVLSGVLDPELAGRLLAAGKSELVHATSLAPIDVDSLRRLARVAEQVDDIQLRQATLGALVALGHGQNASRAELVSLERRISTMPPAPVSNEVLAGLADPEDRGPVPELLSFVAPYLAETFGPPRQAFAMSRRERVSALAGEPLRDEISAWVKVFGLDTFDLYLSPVPSERLVVLGAEPLTIIAGASVTAPLGPFQRLALARALYAIKRGLGPLLSLEEADVSALVAALCSVAGVALNGPVQARQRDFERLISKALPRKMRKLLPERARSVRDTQQNLGVWVQAATASLDRVAAVAVGDASVILADAPAREQPSATQDERARRLLGFMLSPEFESLRQRFGVSIR